MEKKCDFSDFNCGMVFARWAGLNISKTADNLGFHTQQSVVFTQKGSKMN